MLYIETDRVFKNNLYLIALMALLNVGNEEKDSVNFPMDNFEIKIKSYMEEKPRKRNEHTDKKQKLLNLVVMISNGKSLVYSTLFSKTFDVNIAGEFLENLQASDHYTKKDFCFKAETPAGFMYKSPSYEEIKRLQKTYPEEYHETLLQSGEDVPINAFLSAMSPSEEVKNEVAIFCTKILTDSSDRKI